MSRWNLSDIPSQQGRLVDLRGIATLYASTSMEAQSAGHYGPEGLFELKGGPATAKVMARARDVVVAARLWDVSAALNGVAFPAL